MAKVVSSVYVEWNERGQLSHYFGQNFPNTVENIKRILAPSLPFLIVHQLGTFKPSHGLILCSRILDYFLEQKHLLLPINSALKSAMIEFVEKGRITIMKFHPKTRFLANSDSVEEGSRQLINNYISYVSNKTPQMTFSVVKSLIGGSLDGYFDLLQQEIKANRISPSKDNWNINFSKFSYTYMETFSMTWSLELPPNTKLDEMTHIQNERYLKVRDRYTKLAKSLGMIN